MACNYPLTYGSNNSFYSIGTKIFVEKSSGHIIGLFQSTDNGVSWTKLNTVWGDTTYSLAAIDTKLFASTRQGLFSTTNEGVNWLKVDTTGFGNHPIGSLGVSGHNLIISSVQSVYDPTHRSTTIAYYGTYARTF